MDTRLSRRRFAAAVEYDLRPVAFDRARRLRNKAVSEHRQMRQLPGVRPGRADQKLCIVDHPEACIARKIFGTDHPRQRMRRLQARRYGGCRWVLRGAVDRRGGLPEIGALVCVEPGAVCVQMFIDRNQAGEAQSRRCADLGEERHGGTGAGTRKLDQEPDQPERHEGKGVIRPSFPHQHEGRQIAKGGQEQQFGLAGHPARPRDQPRHEQDFGQQRDGPDQEHVDHRHARRKVQVPEKREELGEECAVIGCQPAEIGQGQRRPKHALDGEERLQGSPPDAEKERRQRERQDRQRRLDHDKHRRAETGRDPFGGRAGREIMPSIPRRKQRQPRQKDYHGELLALPEIAGKKQEDDDERCRGEPCRAAFEDSGPTENSSAQADRQQCKQRQAQGEPELGRQPRRAFGNRKGYVEPDREGRIDLDHIDMQLRAVEQAVAGDEQPRYVDIGRHDCEREVGCGSRNQKAEGGRPDRPRFVPLRQDEGHVCGYDGRATRLRLRVINCPRKSA